MHELLKEEIESELGESMEWKTLMQRSFGRMDEEVKEYCHHDDDDDDDDEDDDKNKNTDSCRCKLQNPRQYDTVGSTALVAIVTPHQLIISNCGDSRAVLCRKTSVLPLSSDHKVRPILSLRIGRVFCEFPIFLNFYDLNKILKFW